MTTLTSVKPKKTYLKDYQPPACLFDRIDLEFDVFSDYTLVTAHSRVLKNPLPSVGSSVTGQLRLDGQSLILVSITIDGNAVDATVDDEGLTLNGIPDAFDLKIVTKIFPHTNKAFEGLYLSKGILCTQCESQGFRRITYYVDRPDNMALFSTTIRADQAQFPHLLSNGNLVAERMLPSNRKEVRWEDPFRKPCYLFALVAGDLEFIEDFFTTRSARRVTLRVYVNRGLKERCYHTMESIKKSMKWDEDRFGCEYDLDLFMIAAVDDFNFGAMENKGLNIFNSKYVLSDPATATDQANRNIEAIVGHEYFHNWSGDRITCRDWFQLSLKEGFTVYRDQEFSSDVFSRPSQRIEDVSRVRDAQFSEDAGPNAHAVRPESFVSIENFYTATIYNKGAEVIRMMATLFGWPSFRRASDLYFKTYDGQAVTTDDFVATMEKANGVDMTQFKRWYSQAGTPTVELSGTYDASERTYRLSAKQSCQPTPLQPEKLAFVIPIRISLLGASGNELSFKMPVRAPNSLAQADDVIALTDNEQTFDFTEVSEAPTPSLFRDFSAPVNYTYPYTDTELKLLMKHDSNIFNRWDATQKIFVRGILRAVSSQEDEIRFAPELFEAFQLHLQHAGEERLVAVKLLTMPSLDFLKQFIKSIEPDRLVRVIEQLNADLASSAQTELLNVYRDNAVTGPYIYSAVDAGKRALQNTVLRYLCWLKRPEFYKLALEQFHSADNMTLQEGAMMALRDHACPERNTLMSEFYDSWKHEPNVLNLWHQAKAAASLPNALADTKEIFKSANFDRDNPNNIYATVGVFAFSNERFFHQIDGQGYAFVSEAILAIDKKNSMVASGLASAFDGWKDYEPNRKAQMGRVLDRMLATPGLSKNIQEILGNARGAS